MDLTITEPQADQQNLGTSTNVNDETCGEINGETKGETKDSAAIEPQAKTRQAAIADIPNVLTDIYREDTNIALWQRSLSQDVDTAVAEFVAANPNFEKSVSVSPDDVVDKLDTLTIGSAPKALVDNIAELVEMFCCLFELEKTGLRLTVLNKAMCPRFHVDRVPCRLVTTYTGSCTEWLPHNQVNRNKLGRLAGGQSDALSGLYQSAECINQLSCGDVALIKGEEWLDNEGAGLVHRSPAVNAGEPRLLLTLDFGA
ncbi:DUF1826 domain-containing protein [Shewanella maritima]|uniref:DUF1826 domain-containing protein n=1 Tax=Shewanella maritima TaxID=2520507 RepID=A0A411PDN1_9GAMM|nr:DUF1826 domain-containing protein [Shewanella maritima]QBF81656.1 DUF1826 domain-containing protein [Shewanella maritima]